MIVSRRASAYAATTLAVIGTMVAPALVWAASGGAGLGGSGNGGGSTGPSGSVEPGNGKVTANGNGIRVTTHESVMLRDHLRFTGNAGSSAAGDTIEIERRGHETGWQWAPTAHGTAAPHGGFSATWPVDHIGRFSIRAVIERSQSSHAASASPSLTITVYRPAIATYYGPGSWGSTTACGETLHRNTLGVANRTLPCGTKVAIYYGGKTITVPVIDRGPYANHADWDLTEATSKALNFPGLATIGAVSLRKK